MRRGVPALAASVAPNGAAHQRGSELADIHRQAPGAGFMEMQFYPPGWVLQPIGNGCDPTKWCAALNIDSLSENYNTGVVNNAACLNSAGVEFVNMAFLTKDGQSTTRPTPPTATGSTSTRRMTTS